MSSLNKQIRKPLYYRFIKRTFDIVFSLTALILGLIPSICICFIIYYKDRHNPIFFEKRVGKQGKDVFVWKFRTMVHDSYNHKKYFTEEQEAEWQANHKVKDDPRVLGKLGWFMRSSSIDEFPQFVQVFIGKMSTIGPRIITRAELEYFKDKKNEYLSIRPGLTGLWQVSDRPRPTFYKFKRQGIELDYIQRASLGLDIKIFFKTIKVIIKYGFKKN